MKPVKNKKSSTKKPEPKKPEVKKHAPKTSASVVKPEVKKQLPAKNKHVNKPSVKPAPEKKKEVVQPVQPKPLTFLQPPPPGMATTPPQQDEAPKHDLSKNLELYNRLMAGGPNKQSQQVVPEIPKPVFNPAVFDPRSANEQLQSNRTSGLGGLQSVLNQIAPGAYAIRMIAKDGPNLRVEVLIGDHRFPLDPGDSYCFFSAKEFVKGGYVE